MSEKKSQSTTPATVGNDQSSMSQFQFERIKSIIADYSLWAVMGLVVVFLWLPLLLIIVLSFAENAVSLFPFEGFTLQNYTDLVSTSSLLTSGQQSVILATVSATIATVLGVPAAFALGRHSFTGKEAFRAIVVMPLLIPGLISGICMLLFLNLIGVDQGFLATVLTHSVFGLPFIILPVAARLAAFNQNIEEAARDLGADTTTVLKDITLPIISPAIGAGFLFAWLRSFEDFTRAFFVSGTVDLLTKEMYGMVVFAQDTHVMNPLATIMVVLVIGALFIAMNMGDILKHV